jgi:Na+/H+ antiporter NhaA
MPGPESAVAKIGVLIGSTLAALLGATVLATSSRRRPVTAAPP